MGVAVLGFLGEKEVREKVRERKVWDDGKTVLNLKWKVNNGKRENNLFEDS